jgi:SnoaL-like protein
MSDGTKELENQLTDVQSELRLLADRVELVELLGRYLRRFDSRQIDDGVLRSIFTDDVIIEMPGLTHTGFDGLLEFQEWMLSLWQQTLTCTTDHVVEIHGDEATLRGNLLAGHVHRDDDPGTHFHVGASLEADARRTNAGWRLTRFGVGRVWSQGDPATKPGATHPA